MNPYKALHEKLLAYPMKRLTTGWCYSAPLKCHCAMGAIASVDGFEVSALHSIISFNEFATTELEAWAAKVEMDYADVRMVQCINDSYCSNEDPPTRYLHMVSILGFLGGLDSIGLSIAREKFRGSSTGLFTWLKEKEL